MLFINGPVVVVMAEQPVVIMRSLLDLLQEICERACLIVAVFHESNAGGSAVRDIISVSEGLPMLTCLFETASAVGTVGLSLGITPELNLLSRSVLILLMFFGRVGGLTLIFAALSSAQKKVSKLPKEKITVG